jgi:hypothetical protein
MSPINIDVASYRCLHHAQSLSSSLSPSLSPSLPPVDVVHRRCILPPPLPWEIIVIVVIPAACQRQRQHRILLPPPPCAMIIVVVVPVFLPTASQRQRCILPPPLPSAMVVFVPVLLPTAGQRCALTSTLHPTAAAATRDLCLCHCPRPCPCPRRLSTSCINVASSCRHRLARSLWLLLSPPPVNVDVNVTHRRCILPLPLPCARGGG